MAIGITELEHCALAEIRHLQPCSAYAVRQVFARSATPEWSGSTGAIYPVIKRLLGRGLIEVEPQAGDPRGRRNLRVTAEGERAIREWIVGLEPWTAKATPDPIRTRVSYLGQLSPDERIAFLRDAEKLTEQMLEELRDWVEAAKAVHMYEYLAGRGGLHQLEARLAWLREAISVCEGGR